MATETSTREQHLDDLDARDAELDGGGRSNGIGDRYGPILGTDSKGRQWRAFQNRAGTWGLSYLVLPSGEWKMEQYGRTYGSESEAAERFREAWAASPVDALIDRAAARIMGGSPPLTFTATIGSVNGKAGPMSSRLFELKVFFEDHDITDDAAARLLRQIGRRVSVAIVPEAEQQALPLV